MAVDTYLRARCLHCGWAINNAQIEAPDHLIKDLAGIHEDKCGHPGAEVEIESREIEVPGGVYA